MRNLTNGYKILLWWAFALENKAELFNWRGGFSWVLCGENIKKRKSGRKNVFCVTYLVIRNVPSVVSVLDRVAELVFACCQGQHVSTPQDYLWLSKKWYYTVCFSNMWPPCSSRRRRNLISSPGPVHSGGLDPLGSPARMLASWPAKVLEGGTHLYSASSLSGAVHQIWYP